LFIIALSHELLYKLSTLVSERLYELGCLERSVDPV